MPKLRQSDLEAWIKYVRRTIEDAMNREDKDSEYMAAKLHCVPRTYRYKKQDPRRFSLADFQIISHELGLLDDIIVRIVRGKCTKN